MSPPSATAEIPREVYGRLWRACSGASVHIPTLNSRVYYFPQGHVEHCCAPSVISSFPSTTSPIPCIVSSVELLADPITDEVFAHLRLQPIHPDKFMHLNLSGYGRCESNNDQNNVIITFAKVLTHSDANNGGGFSAPVYCAGSVFPPLDLNADQPFQNLNMADMHGNVWEFRHIYRGRPKRNILTSGWTTYVNSKKLIAGDSVVFMKKSPGQLFIGVRRDPNSNSVPSVYVGDEDGDVKKSFARTGKGKLTAQAVSEAIDRATNGQPFEVVYYPTAGWSEFVVKAEDVEASMAISWIPGTRVKMAMETEDSSRITWYQGTLSCTHQSPWKKLQITWDEPERLQNMNTVNPWQVEVITNSSELHVTLPPTERMMKHPHTAGFMSLERGETSSSQTGLSGMQGARHNEFWSYNPTGFIEETPPQTIDFLSLLPGLGEVSTETNVGSSPSDTFSLNSTNTNQSSGNDLVGNRGPISARGIPTLLFGSVINMQELSESGLVAYGSSEEDGSQDSNDNDDLDGTQLSLGFAPQSQPRI